MRTEEDIQKELELAESLRSEANKQGHYDEGDYYDGYADALVWILGRSDSLSVDDDRNAGGGG